MDYTSFDFRHAAEILGQRPEWRELHAVVAGITREDILAAHDVVAQVRLRAPAGGQTAINSVFRSRLPDWVAEPRLFHGTDERLRGWKMDFFKSRIGVEISFNHAEAIPWTFTRLNIAGESAEVVSEHRIDVGIAVFATAGLKAWARMDAAVGTFELACEWLRLMRPIMPVPILVVGLRADDWEPSEKFRGTRKVSSLPDQS
jgi:hypothetical protein